MSKKQNYTYKNAIDLNDQFAQPTIIINLVRKNTKVLDVGCGNGFLGHYLKENRGCKVWGIERNESWAKEAKEHYEDVVIVDLNYERICERLQEKFDVIILADILEHLISPATVLNQIKKFVTENTDIIISLPNIALWRIRLNLLFGRFNYTNRGILDKTHLRFYTLKSAKELISKSGYKIQNIFIAQPQIPFEGILKLNQIPIIKTLLIEFKKVISKLFPTIFATQFIFFCKIAYQ